MTRARRKSGWQTKAAKADTRKPVALTVIGTRARRRTVLPKTFKKIGIPNLQHMAICNGDGRWRAVVISVYSWAGDELGRERTQSRQTFATSAEAQAYGSKMQARLDRTPLDPGTIRTTAAIRRRLGRARSVRSVSRLFASNGRRAFV